MQHLKSRTYLTRLHYRGTQEIGPACVSSDSPAPSSETYFNYTNWSVFLQYKNLI